MNKNLLFFFALVIFLIYDPDVNGEGTKEISPDPDEATFVISREYSDFGLYGAKDSEKIKISVANTSENIYLGLNNKREFAGGGAFLPGVAFRVVSPSGKIVYSSDMPDLGEEGNIASWGQAVAGPKQLGNAGGYDAIVIDPEEVGDYILEFDTSSADAPDYIGGTSGTRLNINYLDVTVADDAGNIFPGRLHSQGWQISTQAFERPFTGKVYPLVGESAVYEVDLNGIDPFIFIINFNSYGVVDAPDSDPLESRKSRKSKFIAPEYEVFLNPPDETLFPVKIKELKISGRANKISCNITEFCFSSNDKAFLEGYLDFNGNDIQDEEEIQFAKDLDGENETCITWDGKDKNGKLIDKAEFKILSKVGFGMTHLPLFDVEDNKNGYKVKVVKPAGVPDPVLFWDDSEITEGKDLDGLINLNGCEAAQGCHRWEGRGDPTFINQEEQETINTWWFSTIVLDTIVYKTEQEEKVLLSYLPNEVYKSDSSICKGDSLKFHVFNDGVFHFDSQRYNYLWFINGDSLPPDVASQGIKMQENTEVVVQAIDRLGQFCTTSDTIIASVVDKVQLSSMVTFNCKENSGEIVTEIISGNPDSKFIWEEFPQVETGTVNNLAVGTYNLKVVDPEYPLCSADTTFSIDPVNAFVIDSIDVSSFKCAGEDGIANIHLTPQNADYEFSFDNEAFQSQSQIEDLQPGEHTIKIRDRTTLCEVESTFLVPVEKPELLITAKEELCGNKNGRVEVSLIPSGMSKLTLNGAAMNNSIVENLVAGNYKIASVSDKHPLCNVDSTIEITNIESVVNADFTVNDKLFPDSIFVSEDVKFSNQSENGISLVWNFGDGTISEISNFTHAYSEAGKYQVTLEATDENGCKDQISKLINIFERPPCGIAIPNAFSPNNDEENDSIGVRGFVVKMDLKVFNRWGEVIFRTENIKEKWTGVYRGVESPIGVYPYIIDYYCPGNDNKLVKETLVGEITLVR